MGDLYYCRITRDGEGYSYGEYLEIVEPYMDKDYEAKKAYEVYAALQEKYKPESNSNET